MKTHTDPQGAGGVREFTREYLPNNAGYKVKAEAKTGLPLATTYQVENLPGGAQKRTTFLPDGLAAISLIEPDGKRVTTYSDGTEMTLVDKGDERFGMQAPVRSSLEILTGGLTQAISRTRTYTGSWPAIQDVTDTVTINGRTFTAKVGVAASPRTITRKTHAQRTSVTELDAEGRPVKSTVVVPPNHPIQLCPEELIYYPDGPHKGRLYQAKRGTGPDARITTFTYDDATGYLKSITDPLDRILIFQPDPVGRTKTQTLPDGSMIELLHDANGNVAKLAPPRPPMTPLPPDGELHLFDHGPLDFLDTYTPPAVPDLLLDPSTTFAYTPNRLLDWTTKPVNLKIDPVYDNAGRLQSIGGQEERSLSYYDLNAPLDHRGKLETITSNPLMPDEVILKYTYQGNLPKSTTWAGALLGHVEWTYDNDFRVITETVHESEPITFQYEDADGMLTGAGALDLHRDAETGVPTGTTIGNLTDTYTVNAFGELTGYVAKVSGMPVYSVQYTQRDKLGRVVRKTEAIGGGPAVPYEYHYSNADQLSDVFQGEGPCDPSTCVQLAHYEYSLNGNRTLVQYGSEQPIPDIQHAQDRLTKCGNTTFHHFANGERSQKISGQGTTKYTWDVFGNLRRVELPVGSVVDYVIDGQNRRVGKKVDGVLVKGWLYDGPAPVAELDASGAVTARFVYATKAHVPDYMIKLPEGNTYRVITDQLGSVRLVVDVQTGEIKQRIDYDEFGRVLADTAKGFQPFGFAGGLYDPDSTFVRFGAREYDAETGRWLAKDPILFAGGDTNLYAYVGNDPINLIDPLGTDGWSAAESFFYGAVSSLGAGVAISAAAASGTVAGAAAAIAAAGYGGFSLGWTAIEVVTGEDYWTFKKLTPDQRLDRLAGLAGSLVGGAVSVKGYGSGFEVSFGRNVRVAPFGNRTGHPIGEYPHYHRRGVDPRTGQTCPGQGIGRHRPWDEKSTDTSFWDRF